MTINTTNHNTPPHRFPLSITWLWTTLYHPSTFVLALSLLSTILIGASIIPQQPTQLSTPTEIDVWVTELPPIYQKVYPLFNTFGLMRIYQTAWFWFPAAGAIQFWFEPPCCCPCTPTLDELRCMLACDEL